MNTSSLARYLYTVRTVSGPEYVGNLVYSGLDHLKMRLQADPSKILTILWDDVEFYAVHIPGRPLVYRDRFGRATVGPRCAPVVPECECPIECSNPAVTMYPGLCVI